MKKLIVAAAAVAMIGAAQAATQFADYKASLKYVAMVKKTFKAPVTKTETVVDPVTGDISVKVLIAKGDKISMLVKQVKSCTLKGYLVYDECACNQADVKGGLKPAFLIVTGSAQAKEGGKKLPKILEADLLLNYWLQTTTTAQAEGYLFAGQGKNQRPWLAAGTYAFGDDKKYSTEKLFGEYNAKDEAKDKTGVKSLAFFNAWLDASGFGTAKYDYAYDAGTCGDPTETSGYCLNSLTGHVIGGMFNCRADWFEFAPCAIGAAWGGTTDVLTGTWSIKKNTKLAPVSARTLKDDGRFADNTVYPAAILDAVKAATQKLGADGLKVYDQDENKQDWAETWFKNALQAI